MVIVKKRKKNTSVAQLRSALEQFILLLGPQGEDEAIEDLEHCRSILAKGSSAKDIKEVLGLLDEAFEDKHELSAYTHARKDAEGTWNAADELYVASTSVLALMKHFRAGLDK